MAIWLRSSTRHLAPPRLPRRLNPRILRQATSFVRLNPLELLNIDGGACDDLDCRVRDGDGHRFFRNELRGVPELINGVRAGDAKRAAVVNAHLSFIVAVLHHHHAAKDDLIWPT